MHSLLAALTARHTHLTLIACMLLRVWVQVKIFGLKGLRGDSFIQVDGTYYEPAPDNKR